MDKSIKTMINWIKNKIALLSIAMSGIEKNALGQNKEQLSIPITQERRHTQGQLADSLLHGETSQEVLNLKWRTYKILRATSGLRTQITGYDDEGMPITKTSKADKKRGLSKIKLDEFDKYNLEMVIDNSPISTGGNDVMDNKYINVLDEATINYDDKGNIVSATHGEISGEEYYATYKSELPIKVTRLEASKFSLETFTKKLSIRMVSKTERLLEFYVSKYPDEYDRKSRLFISEIKKAIESPSHSDMLDIKEVGFITYNSIGVDDFLEYQYKILKFDKIIEFNGHYVIKFRAEVSVDGNDILEEHRVEVLDKKYENKEAKK